MIEYWVLRRLLGSRKEGMTGGWRKLRHEKFHNFYYTPNIIRMRLLE
jgi:hypothetical protein